MTGRYGLIFAGDFEMYDRIVRSMRRALFAKPHCECERGRWHYLLGQDLIVASDVTCRDTAAALGWSVSWMGASPALAPSTGVRIPALGLAAWLAYLPLRPQGTPKPRWRLHVLEWLHEDLCLSAWIWSRIAAFMRRKGVYVLHGAIVNPRELAQARYTLKRPGSIFSKYSMNP